MNRSVFLVMFFAAATFILFSYRADAATNISATTTDHWAWNDLIGWIDFYNTQTINVSSQALTGYASSSVGDVSLDCHTTRVGDICVQSTYQVVNDTAGNLSGWGWNDQYGWISFWNGNHGGIYSYRVYIDSSGNFHNFAWNDIIGWISFNCADPIPPLCGGSNYKVNTDWRATSTTSVLDSTVYDTGATAGAQFNSIIWQGSQPVGTSVKFQIAVSNSPAGPWNFLGSDGTSATYYYSPTGPASIRLNYSAHNNMRYFRYRAFLVSNESQTQTPRIDDVIVNWSP
ncbi:MAG: hypothetical protein AAB655_01710 [Patescibacteria group bacterium]